MTHMNIDIKNTSFRHRPFVNTCKQLEISLCFGGPVAAAVFEVFRRYRNVHILVLCIMFDMRTTPYVVKGHGRKSLAMASESVDEIGNAPG